MVELKDLKPKAKIKLLNGEILTIRGSYMSENGIVITAKADHAGICDRNVPVEDIAEIVASAKA